MSASVTVSVRFLGPWAGEKMSVECNAGTRLEEVLHLFQKQRLAAGYPEPLRAIMKLEPQEFVRSNIVLLNQKLVDACDGGLLTEVKDGDEVVLLPNILGG